MRALLLAGVVAMGGMQAAQADVIYNLSNVTLSTAVSGGSAAGTLTGSFTTNDARTTVVSFNITASAFGSFAGFVYTPATASVTASSLPSQYFQLDSTNSVNELRLYFTSPLTASGATLATASSFEHEPSGGNRFPTGSIVAASTPPASVPEPASSALLGLGLAGVAALGRRQAG